jgi:hypothetical protein
MATTGPRSIAKDISRREPPEAPDSEDSQAHEEQDSQADEQQQYFEGYVGYLLHEIVQGPLGVRDSLGLQCRDCRGRRCAEATSASAPAAPHCPTTTASGISRYSAKKSAHTRM